MSSRSSPVQLSLKVWLQDNNTTVMSVLIFVVGVVLIGKGIGGIF
ncbi:hypothetical protein ACSW29_24060 [Rhodococcus sp. GB-02]